MKKLLYIFCLLTPYLAMGQGWVTKNASVVVKDDAHVVVAGTSGHYTNKGTGLIFTRVAGTFHVRGNWINNGSSSAIGNNVGVVVLDGGAQRIMGTTPTSFNTLEFTGTANKILDVDVLVGGGYKGAKSGNLHLNDKSLYINSQTLTVNNSSTTAITRSGGLLVGDTDPVAGYGKVQWNIRSQTAGTGYTIPFGTVDFIYIPLIVNVNTSGVQQGDSGFIVLATYPTNTVANPNNRPLPLGVAHLNNPYGLENDLKSVDRFYIVNGGGFFTNPGLSFGFPYVDREWDGSLGGSNFIDETRLEAARFDGASGSWNYDLRGSTNSSGNNTVSENITDFEGAWVLHNSPYCPVPNFTFNHDCFNVPILFNDSSYIEIGNIDSTVWVYEASNLINQNSLLHDFSSDGSFLIKRKVRGERGCWDSITKTVQVFPLPVGSFTYIDTCFKDITQFASTSTSSAGMPLNHKWTLGGGDYFTPNSTHKFVSAGLKTIRLETENTFGCLDTLIQNIEIAPLPDVHFNFENICERQEAFFYDSTTPKGSIDEWRWTVKGRTVSFLQDHSQVFNIAGSYPIQLTAKNTLGCVDSVLERITIWPKALARFNQYPKDVYITEPYVNLVENGANANSWEWRFGDLSDDEYGPEVFHQYPDTGLFSARLIANNDFGCADTFYRTILIKPDLKIFIPNAFSPGGGNDVNTTFKPGGTLHGLKKMKMDIYTRWGELIFHSEDINTPWDGIYQGQYVQNGVYLYLIQVKDIYNEVFFFSGTVNVVK